MINNKITEQFHTIQGEGPSIGTPAYFLRLAGCNLWCHWCDSMHSVDPELFKGKTFEIDYSQIPKNCPLVVITGGEPTLFDLTRLRFEILKMNNNCEIEVESNATIFPKINLDLFRWNLSPKLISSRQKTEPHDLKRLSNLKQWVEYSRGEKARVIFKFVITSKVDLAEVQKLLVEYQIPISKVYLMNEGITSASQMSPAIDYLVEYCKVNGLKFTPRLHVLLWGNRRGV